jgi:hypothetical protein
MVRFRAIANVRRLGFDEVADMNVAAQVGSGTQLGERTDDRAGADTAAGEHDGKFKLDIIANLDIGKKRRAVNPAALADDRLAANWVLGPITVSLPMITPSSI